MEQANTSPTAKRRAKFVELVNKRVNNALYSIDLIGNLSNASAYEYSKEDANKIIKALTAEVESVRLKFAGKGQNGTEFKIE